MAIVLVGALIIFGVTKMVSTDRSYKDLVREMKSKTFGNRWIAAYELSKRINSSKVPEEDIPWLIENLEEVYQGAKDPRTKEFIVVAMGALNRPETIEFQHKVLDVNDGKLNFHALVALGNMKNPVGADWEKVMKFLSSPDAGLQQAAILALATHKVLAAKQDISVFLTSPSRSLKYASALALINYKDERALPVLNEILLIPTKDRQVKDTAELDANEVVGLKLNILHAVQREKWNSVNDTLQKLAANNDNKKVSLKAQEVLKLLKN